MEEIQEVTTWQNRKRWSHANIVTRRLLQTQRFAPHCGAKNKKPIYKRTWFIVLFVVLLLGAIGGSGEESTPSKNTNANTSVNVSTEATMPEITYCAYDVSELVDDLNGNALKASEKYKGQYVELTGRLNVIDSNGKYISIVPSDEDFAIIGVQCYIKSDEQKNVVMDLSIGDILTVKGYIKDVGEVLGYSLDIDEIRK